MSSAEELNNWLDIQDLVKDDFLLVLTEQEIVSLIKVLDIDIPGFSKRINTAPFPILKNRFINYLKKIPLKGFFRTFVIDTYDELKDKEYEQGIKTIASNNELKKSEIIALLGTLYPTKYRELRQEFIKNIDQPNNLLSNVIELESEDILNSIVKRHRNTIYEKYNSLDWQVINSNSQSIQSYFNQKYKLNSNAATTLIFTEKINELGFNVNEKHLLYELSIFELLNNLSRTMSKLEVIEESKQEKDELYSDLLIEIEKLKTNQKRKILNAREEFERKIENKDQLINYLKKEKEIISDQRIATESKLKEKINNLQNELTSEQSVSNHILNEWDQILLFTERAHEYKNMSEKELIKELNELEKYLSDHKNDNIFFIDVFGMSTQNRRDIRKLCNQTNHTVKLVNGTPVSIIRNIIYHIEGVGLT